jgi:copper(I)-binding protein
MSRLRPIALALGLALLVAGCGSEPESESQPSTQTDSLMVSDAWVRATTGSKDVSMTGAFMEISNKGDSTVRLIGAMSPDARMVQVHTMVMQGGKMVMQELEGGLEVTADSHAHLRPGGDHVMLMGLRRQLAAGDEVALTLEFSDGTEQDLIAPVKEFTEEEDHYDPSMAPSPSMTPGS